jgi:hypothetical protein
MSYQVRASILLANNVANTNLQQQKKSIILNLEKLCYQQYRLQSTASGTSKADVPKEQPKGVPYSKLTIGVPKEIYTNERRVAITPTVVKNLTKKGFHLSIEENAGLLAKFANKEYEEAGAKITNIQGVYSAADIILKVRAPEIKVKQLFSSFFFAKTNKIVFFLFRKSKKILKNTVL